MPGNEQSQLAAAGAMLLLQRTYASHSAPQPNSSLKNSTSERQLLTQKACESPSFEHSAASCAAQRSAQTSVGLSESQRGDELVAVTIVGRPCFGVTAQVTLRLEPNGTLNAKALSPGWKVEGRALLRSLGSKLRRP